MVHGSKSFIPSITNTWCMDLNISYHTSPHVGCIPHTRKPYHIHIRKQSAHTLSDPSARTASSCIHPVFNPSDSSLVVRPGPIPVDTSQEHAPINFTIPHPHMANTRLKRRLIRKPFAELKRSRSPPNNAAHQNFLSYAGRTAPSVLRANLAWKELLRRLHIGRKLARLR